jgi:hypothetical protein
MRRLDRSASILRPLLHFFVLAALLFAGARWLAPESAGEARTRRPPDDRSPIVVSETRRSQLAEEWRALTGLPPSPAEMRGLIDHEIDEEILFREAIATGLHRSDVVARHRLVQNMRFLEGLDAARAGFEGEADESAGDEEQLVRAAIALGMHRSDIVVRRRLIQRMQAALEVGVSPPADDEIRAFAEAHPERALSPARYRLSYAFESDRSPREAAPQHRPDLPLRGLFTAREAARTFGEAVGSRLATMQTGEVLGPVDVPEGRYILRLDATIPAAPHAFASIRGEIAEALMVERRRQARSQAMVDLRRRYRIEGPLQPPQASLGRQPNPASEPTT